MGSLQERLARATAQRKGGGAAEEEELLLPLATAERFLASHPLLAALGVSAADAHAAVLDVHRRHTAPPPPAPSPPAPSSPGVGEGGGEGCGECGAPVEVDHHGGDRVCSACGLVQARTTMNVTPEFVPAPDPGRGATGVPGVPDWLLRHCPGEGGRGRKRGRAEGARSAYWDELEHFNGVFHLLPRGEMEQMDALLDAWVEGGRPRAVRVAAALLYFPLRRQARGAATTRERIRKGDALGEVERVAPLPSFSCPECGFRAHTHKEARLHCRLGGVWGRKR